MHSTADLRIETKGAGGPKFRLIAKVQIVQPLLAYSLVLHIGYQFAHLSSEMAANKLVVGVIMGLIALGLVGCGCDEEEASKCINEKSAAALISGGVCGALENMVKCAKDNDCCDDDGVKKLISDTGSACSNIPSC